MGDGPPPREGPFSSGGGVGVKGLPARCCPAALALAGISLSQGCSHTPF